MSLILNLLETRYFGVVVRKTPTFRSEVIGIISPVSSISALTLSSYRFLTLSLDKAVRFIFFDRLEALKRVRADL